MSAPPYLAVTAGTHEPFAPADGAPSQNQPRTQQLEQLRVVKTGASQVSRSAIAASPWTRDGAPESHGFPSRETNSPASYLSFVKPSWKKHFRLLRNRYFEAGKDAPPKRAPTRGAPTLTGPQGLLTAVRVDTHLRRRHNDGLEAAASRTDLLQRRETAHGRLGGLPGRHESKPAGRSDPLIRRHCGGVALLFLAGFRGTPDDPRG